MNRAKWVSGFFSLVFFLAVGCGTMRDNGKALLPRHHFDEARMSTAAEPGYLPSGVWRLRGEKNTVYLAGTCHLVNEEQIPFPSPYYAAYRDSKIIYIEYDTQSIFSQLRMVPKTLRWMASHRKEFICPGGRNLSSYLKPETSERLEKLLGKKEFQKRQKFTPLFLLLMNEFDAMSQGGEATSGVDDIFELAAKKDHKPLRSLDDRKVMDTAILALDGMLDELRTDIEKRGPDAVIGDNIFNDEKKPEEDMDRDWRRGDVAAIEKLQDDMKKESPAFYKEGLVDRNRKWLPAIERALKGKQNVMILVGVAHIPGKDGLLDLLKRDGYEAEQMYGLDRP